VLARDQYGETVATSSCASPLLAQRRHGAWEADRDRAVEQPDVDSELERVRGCDAEQVSFDEPPLDVAPLPGGVARTVGGEARAGLSVDPVDREAVNQLGSAPALREAD